MASPLCATKVSAHATPIYMVASSHGPPALHVAGSRLSIQAILFAAVAATMAESAKSAIALPLFLKERPSAEAVRDWLEEAKPMLSADETSIVDGDQPRTMLQYQDNTVPATLVADPGGTGITAGNVAARQMQQQAVIDANAVKLAQRTSHLSEIEDGLFKKLQKALKPNAPLLLARFEVAHKQGTFAKRHSGSAAWAEIENMAKVGAMIAGEDSVHDMELARMVIKPIGEDATPDQFSLRIVRFIKDHKPYLERPFPTPESFSAWIINQTPSKHKGRALDKYEKMTTAEQQDSHGVLAMIIDMMAKARSPLEILRESTAADFVGLVTPEEPAPSVQPVVPVLLTTDTGRRPPGIEGGRDRGRGRGGGRGSGGGGRGGGDGRPTGCSTAAPRGPTCTRKHNPPCWRDNQWPGPLPARVHNDKKAKADIESDRTANATRLGERCVTLAEPKADESVNVLDEQAIAEQWPEGIDTNDDVPPELPSVDTSAGTSTDVPSTGDGKKPVVVPTELEVQLAVQIQHLQVQTQQLIAAQAQAEAQADAKRKVAEQQAEELIKLRVQTQLQLEMQRSGLQHQSAEIDRTAHELDAALGKIDQSHQVIQDQRNLLHAYSKLAPADTEVELPPAEALADARRDANAEWLDIMRARGIDPGPPKDLVEVLKSRGISTREQALAELRVLSEASKNGDIAASLKLGRFQDTLLRIALAEPATAPPNVTITEEAGPPVLGRVQHPSGRSVDARGDGPPRVVETVPLGRHVADEKRADFRVNLTVPSGERDECEAAGGLFDEKNKVLYTPPRVSLRPFARWLPFDLDAVHPDPASGTLPLSPAVARAAGPVKADGSPDMRMPANKRVRDMLKPAMVEVQLPPRRDPDDIQAAGMEVASELTRAVEVIVPVAILSLAVIFMAFYRSALTGLNVCALYAWQVVFTVALGYGGEAANISDAVSTNVDKNFTVGPLELLQQAADGNPLVVTLLLIGTSMLVIGFAPAITRKLNELALGTMRVVKQGAANVVEFTRRYTTVSVILLFIWFCVLRASAHSPSGTTLLQRQLLPAIAKSASCDTPIVQANISLAHAVSERYLSVAYVDFVDEAELVALLDPDQVACAIVWDSGARRHVVRNRQRFAQGTIKPCPFRVRGINSSGKQPECMGDAEEWFPLDDGTVTKQILKDAVLIPEAPHDVVGAGLFEFCDWTGKLPDGRKVVLENHRFILMPHCTPGQQTHTFAPSEAAPSKTAVLIAVENREHVLEAKPKNVTFASPSVPPRPKLAPPSDLLYWFSGTDVSESSLAYQWVRLTSNACLRRDTKSDSSHNLLRDQLYESDLAAGKNGTANRAVFSIPCNTHSVCQFRKYKNLRVLRTDQEIMGCADLPPSDRAKVNASNLLTQRSCSMAQCIHDQGGLFIIENPVRRNDPDGPWKRFNSGKFPRHGSLWQVKCVVDLARATKARVLHVPLCWFAHETNDVCSVEQKYITLMYSPELEPALQFLRAARCEHRLHEKKAIGFNDDGSSRSEPTAAYPAELNRVLPRALAYPNKCASDESWAKGPPDEPVLNVTGPSDSPLVDSPAAKGLPGDHGLHGARGAVVARGHSVNMRRLTSRQVHESMIDKPVEVLRSLPDVCDDAPKEWRNMLDLSEVCPDCLAGKQTHFGSHSHLPEVTKCGEIIAFDLLILRTPDVYTGGTICFAAIDLYSDWDFFTKILHKTDAVECILEVIQLTQAKGHRVMRFHTDGEAIFHSKELYEATKAKLSGVGCMLTTGADYDHRQNSKIERHLRRLGDDARPGFLRSLLADRFYQCALVDASAKHKLMPLARLPGQSPTTLWTSKPGKALPHRPFGSLAYVTLEHELNDSTHRLNKAHARSEPGILLAYGVTGVLRDRHVPAWTVHVPTLQRNKPMVSPHVTVVLGCYPGDDGIRAGLNTALHNRTDSSGQDVVTLEADSDGGVAELSASLVPETKDDPTEAPPSEATVVEDNERSPAFTAEPTIAQRLRRTVNASHPHARSRAGGALDFSTTGDLPEEDNLVVLDGGWFAPFDEPSNALERADDTVLLMDESPVHELRETLTPRSFHSSEGGTDDPAPFTPTLANAPWLFTPRGGDISDEAVLTADLNCGAIPGLVSPDDPRVGTVENDDEVVLLCDDTADGALHDSLRRKVTSAAPRRIVRFPWGDVPAPWVSGYSTVYDSGIDDSVFVMDEEVLTSLNEDDDPQWEAAVRGNESQKWYDAADNENENLKRFGVYEKIPADQVPADEDIFDTMLLCRRKRGENNEVTKHKVRCVLCGNQMVASAKRGQSKTTADMRTHSPACRSSSLKCCFAVGVLDDLRQLDFDVDAAYLQGVYVDRRVFARAPKHLRTYDERGVEEVWLLKRALYGGPDSGRLWYNTFAHYLMSEETECPFQRCHFEPCVFVSVIDGMAKPPKRIICSVYVDDGRTWDNVPDICDAFYERLATRFSITRNGGGLTFMIGIDISLGVGWLKICSTTYIRSMCARWLDYPIEEYDYVGTPAHPKLMDLFEAAFQMKGNTPPELATRFRSLVGGLIFPCPSTRPDCLFAVGIHARAMDFATEDLFRSALYCLVYMGQTHDQGITYSRNAPDARRLVHWTDSDWSVQRSTTGGTAQLAGGSVHAVSRRQECVTGSSTHAEVVAASANSNDVVWERGLLAEIGLPQEDPTPLMADANNVLTLVQNLISSKLTRHITRRELVVRERDAAGILAVTKVSTHDNLADLFTKALDRDPFVKLSRLVLNVLAKGAIYLVPRARRATAKAASAS